LVETVVKQFLKRFAMAFEWLFSVVSTSQLQSIYSNIRILLIGVAVPNTHSEKPN